MLTQDIAPFNASDSSAAVRQLFLQKLQGKSEIDPSDVMGTARWDRNLLEAFGATLTQRQSETGAYRMRGQDSLTWGDQGDWSGLNIIRYSLRQERAQERADALNGYLELKSAIRQAHRPTFPDGYLLRNAEAVNAYVGQHAELCNFLQESRRQLRRFFGAEPAFVLEVVKDPEVPTPSDFLFVNIRTTLSVDDAMARLDQFDEAWYLDQVDLFGELVNFNLEFYDL